METKWILQARDWIGRLFPKSGGLEKQSCPFCQGSINSGAVKCNLCNTWLTEPEQAVAMAEQNLLRREQQVLGGGIAALLVVAIVGSVLYGEKASVRPIAKKPHHAAAQTSARMTNDVGAFPHHYLKLVDGHAWNAEFGTVLMLSATVQNRAPIAIKNPVITCLLFGDTGSLVGSVSKTVSKVVPKGESIRFTDANMGVVVGRWQRLSCSVTSAIAVTSAG